MALVLADRVRETTTTTGTGPVTLGGAYPGFQTFSAAIGNANDTYYTIANIATGEWEVGIGAYTSSGNTLSRDTVLSSSNAGSLVVFSTGTKDVFVTQPAERAVYVNAANTQVSVPQLAATSITNSGTTTLNGNQIISVTDNTNAALRITQTGTGNALLVEDSTNPDSSPFVIDQNGNVISGYTAALTSLSGITPSVQVVGASLSPSSIGAFDYSNTTNGSFLTFAKSRSGSIGTETIVQSGDNLLTIRAYGSDGVAPIQAAQIRVEVDGTPGVNDMPGRLVFSTTADGASTPTERMRIDSAGQTKFSYNAVIETTDNTNAALRITQLGTGNALLVEDSANPDSTPFAIDTNGRILDGLTTARTNLNVSSTPQVQIEGTGFATSTLSLTRNSADTGAPSLALSKTRGTAVLDNTVVASGDSLGRLDFYGADGTNLIQAAGITAAVDGAPGTNDMPGRLVFSTTADGASTPTERMRIDSEGRTVLTADNNGISGTAPINTLRFNDSDTTSSSAQPTGRVEFFVNDGSAGGTGVGSFIEGRAAGSAGGGYLVIGTSASGATGAADVLTISVTGGITIARDAVTSPVSNDGNVFSGTYTPTYTAGTNNTTGTVSACQYLRVGNTVTVSGSISVTCTTAAATYSIFEITLPIASGLTANRQCAGTAAYVSTTVARNTYAVINCNTTTDRAEFIFACNFAGANVFYFNFTYQVI